MPAAQRSVTCGARKETEDGHDNGGIGGGGGTRTVPDDTADNEPWLVPAEGPAPGPAPDEGFCHLHDMSRVCLRLRPLWQSDAICVEQKKAATKHEYKLEVQ